MPEKILILSDLHLGRPRHSVASALMLRPVWQGVDRLILNGDVAEIHHPRHRSTAARETIALLDACEEDGVEVTLLSGNHDPFLSDLRHMACSGGRVFITHGDALHPAIAPWSPRASAMRSAFERAIGADAQTGESPLERHLRAAQFAAHAEWQAFEHELERSSLRSMLIRPWALWQVIDYWRRFPGLVAAFGRKHYPEAAVLVTGHTHHQGIWRIDERTVINTGSFGFPGRPRGVVISGNEVAVHAIKRRTHSYMLVPDPITRIQLAQLESPDNAPRSATNIRPVRDRLHELATT